jgi:hypothetical protein
MTSVQAISEVEAFFNGAELALDEENEQAVSAPCKVSINPFKIVEYPLDPGRAEPRSGL